MSYFKPASFFSLIKGNDKIRKSLSLFTSMTLGIFAGIFVSILNTRFLGKEQYGDFKFLIDIFNFFVTFLTFGFFYTGGRILARVKTIQERKKIFGEIVSVALVIGVFLIIVVSVFSLFQERIFNRDLRLEIWLCTPLLFVIPLQLSLEQLLQGDNRIYSLSIMRIGPRLSYIGIVIGLYFLLKFNLRYALIAHYTSFLLIICSIIWRYRPVFNTKFTVLNQLWKENKTYGFPVYFGAITGVASNYLAGISISYFIDNVNVGFYGLALTASMPLAMLPASFGITFFKDFISMKKIPSRIILATFIIGISLLILFLIFIEPIVVLLYSKEFLPVIKLAYFISIGSLCHGFGDFFNRFLGAKGLGKQLRNANFILGIINVLGYVFLVYFFNTIGAAITKMIAGISYLLIMVLNYQRYIQKETQ